MKLSTKRELAITATGAAGMSGGVAAFQLDCLFAGIYDPVIAASGISGLFASL